MASAFYPRIFFVRRRFYVEEELRNRIVPHLLILSLLILVVNFPATGETWPVSSDLQLAINIAGDGDTLLLEPGRYAAVPAVYAENICGNCEDPLTTVQATRGFVIDAKSLVIRGRKSGPVILETGAGYGVLILNAKGVVLENLRITAGRRDADGRATDAAVVIKNSQATIRRCMIHDNTDYIDSTVVGIGGVIVREGSEARIEQCVMLNNSWDGIALYRGAWATITDCVIDSGRGAGIGVTWDAVAICLRNRISHYWKGLGAFGTSTVIARNNAVFDNLGWGIIASGSSTLIAENNVSVHNGNCGLAIWNQTTRGRMVNNISAYNGWRNEWVCPCVGFWNSELDPAGWNIAYNLLWDNAAGNAQGLDSSLFLIADPLFADSLSFRPRENSPVRGAGDPAIINVDGNRSDIGLTGGPAAVRR